MSTDTETHFLPSTTPASPSSAECLCSPKRRIRSSQYWTTSRDLRYPSPPMSNAPSPTRPSLDLTTTSSKGSDTGGVTRASSMSTVATSVAYPAEFLFRPSTTSRPPEQRSLSTLAAESQETTTLSTQTGAAKSGRKSKAHVASACVNCKRAHLSCDVSRPCARCVASGKQDTCFDVQHKKRGRPRLREEGDFKVEQSAHDPRPAAAPSIPSGSIPAPRSIAATRSTAFDSFRSARPHGEYEFAAPAAPKYTPLPSPLAARSIGSDYTQPAHPAIHTFEVPTAYLNLDLVLLKSNEPFRQIVSAGRDISGLHLGEFITPADRETLSGTRALLREEREFREPIYMPPIVQVGDDPLGGAAVADVELYTQGFNDRTYRWKLRQDSLGHRDFPARVRLAKGDAYFVAVTLPSFRPVQFHTAQAAHPPFGARETAFGHSRGPSMETREPLPYPQRSAPRPLQADSRSMFPVASPLLAQRQDTSHHDPRSYRSPQPPSPFQQQRLEPYAQSRLVAVPRLLPMATPPASTAVRTPPSLSRDSVAPYSMQLPPLAPPTTSSFNPVQTPASNSSFTSSTQPRRASDEASGEEGGGRNPRKRRKLDLGDVLH